MGDAIVSCPGCSKRYSVPAGAPPGQFPCQDCGAVVVYGRSGAAAGPAGRAMAPHAPKAQAQAGAASAGKRKSRAAKRGRDEDDDEGGRAGDRRRGSAAGRKQESPMPWILAIVGVALLGFIIVVVGREDPKETDTPAADAASKGDGSVLTAEELAAAGSRASETGSKAPPSSGPPAGLPPAAALAGGDGEPSPGDSGGIRTAARRDSSQEKTVNYETVANPPTGGNYGKSVDDLREMIKADRASVVRELEHLPDTPADVKAAIDADCALIGDPDSGGPGLQAEDRMRKAGRAAIPRLLSLVARLDFPSDGNAMDHIDKCKVADSVDRILRDVTGYTKYSALQFGPSVKMSRYRIVIEHWFVWWHNTGFERASFPKKAEVPDEE